MNCWEIIADNLKKAGWSWDCVSAIDSNGRTIWIVDAHCDDGKRFVVHADERLTAFVESNPQFEPSVCKIKCGHRDGLHWSPHPARHTTGEQMMSSISDWYLNLRYRTRFEPPPSKRVGRDLVEKRITRAFRHCCTGNVAAEGEPTHDAGRARDHHPLLPGRGRRPCLHGASADAPQAGEGRLLRGLREDAARLGMDRDVELRIRWRDASERDQRIKVTQLIRVQLIRELSR
jgi:hypothetical protein